MNKDTDDLVRETFTRVRTISIKLGKDADLTLESTIFGGTHWMLEFSNGDGTEIDNEIATALIAAINGNRTELSFAEFYMSIEEAEEMRQEMQCK